MNLENEIEIRAKELIRVYRGGNAYSVFVLDDTGLKYEILLQNEYSSR